MNICPSTGRPHRIQDVSAPTARALVACIDCGMTPPVSAIAQRDALLQLARAILADRSAYQWHAAIARTLSDLGLPPNRGTSDTASSSK